MANKLRKSQTRPAKKWMNLEMACEASQIVISDFTDVAWAVRVARRLAEQVGFGETDQFMFGTAVSELATNLYRYAKGGEIILKTVLRDHERGIEVISQDKGPGIEDVCDAMRDHWSSAGSLGLGLPSVKRIMDEFEIESERGRGTTVLARMWRK